MNFLIDMDLSPRWADFLTGAGFVAVHWSNEGRPDASDRALMQWASARDYIVISTNLDILAARDGVSPSIFLVRGVIYSLSPDVLGNAVLAMIRMSKDELANGGVVGAYPSPYWPIDPPPPRS
jgi:predicted nuclease of predicted toxin-antitoxin system